MAWQCTFPPTIVPPSCQRSSLYRRLDPIPPPSLNFVSFTETLTEDDRFGNGDVVVVRYGGRQRRSAFVRGFSTVVSLLFQIVHGICCESHVLFTSAGSYCRFQQFSVFVFSRLQFSSSVVWKCANRELLRRGYKPDAVFFGDFKEA
ncbi:hypothetical protein SSX86_013404 [Deinandra increscens subsp. villosa]|uniref:Uncharacterized protein n=1 Tax=Deinandra increscens subsp. villosa TaxID=3103831 RepID=A0AAP0DAA1_9ASTR